ncbi:hypothetical protein UFOVP1319_50 [uncultured Caudovirales phage]|uniref:Uncharacterized protein n=1 Tax=uncultured Caudovirales phage TaxID=2100421 RepID=A0A6J5SQP0_9CAUD|nr:hypothetical protein UFOVP478_33 [uncultured Caudovirales phage]CAB4191031.1 hypothetical protein UFOVP1225_8 [uncultured Caudovirales phage]CAB4198077.1 hypothetical protein UFOVP1319_50 [uncultured Caudovirales phage]CAB4217094.1 hypothetical protein UFOVP1591_8 [uncultured Caudovirales phage]
MALTPVIAGTFIRTRRLGTVIPNLQMGAASVIPGLSVPTTAITYPFLIISVSQGSVEYTFITAPGWNLAVVTNLTPPQTRTIHLLSRPTGGTLNAFTAFQTTSNSAGLVIPPFPHTINSAGQIPTIYESDGLQSITATTLKYVNFNGNDANSLQTLSLPALKGGNLRFSNTDLANHGRTAFPAYVGNNATFGNFEIMVIADGVTMDFPVMTKIKSITVGPNTADPLYDCTMPLLNEVTDNVIIEADPTSNISLPSLVNLGSSGLNLNSRIWGDAIVMPLALLTDNSSASLTLGTSSNGVSSFYLAITSMRQCRLYIEMAVLPSPFQIFATVQTVGTVGYMYITLATQILADGATIWAHLDAKLPSGGTTTIEAPEPTGLTANASYLSLVGKGYTCSFTPIP